jgi:hypothetical protein
MWKREVIPILDTKYILIVHSEITSEHALVVSDTQYIDINNSISDVILVKIFL